MLRKIAYIVVSLFLNAFNLSAKDSLSIDPEKVDSVTTFSETINKNDIAGVVFPRYELQTAIGICFGGSNIAGVDFLFKNHTKYFHDVSIQAGIGYTGFDVGINYNLGEWNKIGSLLFGLQYRYTGFGNDDTWGHSTSNIGPIIIFRGQKWFTTQIGAGYILNKGGAYTGSEDRKMQIHAGIGIYLEKKWR